MEAILFYERLHKILLSRRLFCMWFCVIYKVAKGEDILDYVKLSSVFLVLDRFPQA